MQTVSMKKSSLRRTRFHKRAHAGPDYSVPALDKGLDVFEALASSYAPLSLTELATKIGQTPSAVFRILNRLESRAYVLRDPVSNRYALSLKLSERAHSHSPVERIIASSTKPMRDLAQRVKESVHLSVLSHGRGVVLLDVGSPMRFRFAHEIGSQFSPVLTNSGRLLLAYLSGEELADLLAGDPDYARLSKEQREEFHEELKKIRRQRYSVSSSEERAGMKDLAVLVGNPAIGATAALAIACLTGGKNSADINRLTLALQECAAAITGSMGVTYDRSQAL